MPACARCACSWAVRCGWTWRSTSRTSSPGTRRPPPRRTCKALLAALVLFFCLRRASLSSCLMRVNTLFQSARCNLCNTVGECLHTAPLIHVLVTFSAFSPFQAGPCPALSHNPPRSPLPQFHRPAPHQCGHLHCGAGHQAARLPQPVPPTGALPPGGRPAARCGRL
jgi:hypothetical protein